MKYEIEYTDTFGGEANYSWVRRATINMPELTHYGYDGGTNYALVKKAQKTFQRELIRKAKRKAGLSGVRGVTYDHGDMIEFRPYGSCAVLFVTASYDD